MVRAYTIPKNSLVGKNVIVTGGNFGLGRAVSLALALDGGANVIIASRSAERMKEAKTVMDVELTKANAKGSIETAVVDISHMESVRTFAKSFLDQNKPLDILINNAGLVVTKGCKTSEGFEIHYALAQGHFLLSILLLPALKKAPSARIVTVSSHGHLNVKDIQYERLKGDSVSDTQTTSEAFSSYCVSKLANIYHSRWLGLEMKKQNVPILTASLHPGAVATGIWKELPSFLRWLVPILMLTEEQGARTILYCATSPDVKETGLYYTDCHTSAPGGIGKDDAKMQNLINTMVEWVRLLPIESHL